MKTIKLTLPEFWASSLINGDSSGLEDDEVQELENWLSWAKNQGYGLCLDANTDERFFTKHHDASEFVLACDCMEYIFEVTA
jgi:L-rhamnose isomerase